MILLYLEQVLWKTNRKNKIAAELLTIFKTKRCFKSPLGGDLEGPISLMENAELIVLLNKELTIDIAEKISYAELHAQLSAYINQLIKNDFDKLIVYLYRIDVNEQKLKSLLQQNPNEDAGKIIATLIIERQQQKIKSRQQFSQREGYFDEEEKW